MHESWTRRILRAEDLAADGGGAPPLLPFYGKLLRALLDLRAREHGDETIESNLLGLRRAS